jgi:hypothetical protein
LLLDQLDLLEMGAAHPHVAHPEVLQKRLSSCGDDAVIAKIADGLRGRWRPSVTLLPHIEIEVASA